MEAVLRLAVRNEFDYAEYESLWQRTASCPHRPDWIQAAPTGRDLWLFFRSYKRDQPPIYRNRDQLIDAEVTPWVTHVASAQCELPSAASGTAVPPSSRIFNVLVSSPMDLRPERLMVATICKELAAKHRIQIRPILWEGGGTDHRDVPSLAPYQDQTDVQDIITNQLRELGGIDVYVGMVWTRMGTKTGPFRSGTEAELVSARAEGKRTGQPAAILFYHKVGPIPYKADKSQLPDVEKFVSELKTTGGLVAEFETVDGFATNLRAHLEQAIARAARAGIPKALQCPQCSSSSLTFDQDVGVDWDRGDEGEPVASGYAFPIVRCLDCDWVFDSG